MLQLRKISLIVLALCSLFVAVPALAQDAQNLPPEVNLAFQTLSAELGVTVTPDNADTFTWEEFIFATAALGCPVEGQSYAQVETNGYQIEIVYQGVLYDYRVASNGDTAVLCRGGTGTVIPITPQPVQPVEPTVPAQPTTAFECNEDLEPRLAAGEVARTTPSLGSNIRSQPDLNAEDIGTIPESTTFNVVGGPVCGPEGYSWWEVEHDGIRGWTIQGQNGLYYVEPVPQPLLPTTEGITALNTDNLQPLTVIQGNLLGIVEWSPDGQFIAVADASTANPAIWFYRADDLSQVPLSVETTFEVSAMAFSPDGTLLAAGDPEGSIHLVSTETLETVASFVAHDTAVLDVAFSPDGRYIVSVDDNYSALFFGIVDN